MQQQQQQQQQAPDEPKIVSSSSPSHYYSCPICFRTDDEATANNISEDHAGGGGGEDSTTHLGRRWAYSKSACEHVFCMECLERLLFSCNTKNTPTLSDCPVCRAPISYFDLVYCSNTTTNNSENEERVHPQQQQDTAIFPQELQGAVFYTEQDGVGKGSFHFPSAHDASAAASTG